ncbi:MAG: glucosamine-6-phosphate deaminase [Erysipelotrichaceae bacterium]|nr:glucosamine-6-phosphate deaminase [Erysipelotrichaceae bacterium]MBR5755416.1 glucosamine-6-phosphate deaminase [Erysipelotrichaceae bacterium]
MFNLMIVKNYDEASDMAFKVMKDYLKPGKVLGLATGSTPLGLYSRMVKDHEENKTSYAEIKTFNLDEYVGLPVTHPESYYAFMYRNLFSALDINEENVHIPSGMAEDLEKECQEYENLISKAHVDIQLLGIGSDGHIGFNEPGTPFDSITHVTDLAESTIKDNCRFFENDITKVPTQAVTQGIGTIMKAKNILLIATGENKAQAVKDMLQGEVSEECPASILQKHDNVTIILDEAAASLLK